MTVTEEIMTIERTSPAVVTVRFEGIRAGWEQWILLRSDAHHDSPACNRTLEKKHLDEMILRGGLWADFGDLFDAMQGKFDPRRNYDDIRPEDKRGDYYDSIAKHAAEFYTPYLDRCILLAEGNHETAVTKNASISLLDRLVQEAKAKHGLERDVLLGKYGGWIRFLFEFQKTARQQVRLRYLHGYGGSAPVSKGVIQTNRQAVFLPDADVVINGHNHNAYILPLVRDRITHRGRQFKDIQWHGRIPGYKDDYADGTKGYAVEGGYAPTPLGSLWLRLWVESDHISYKVETEIEGSS